MQVAGRKAKKKVLVGLNMLQRIHKTCQEAAETSQERLQLSRRSGVECSSSGRSRRWKEFSEQRRQNFAIKARKELS